RSDEVITWQTALHGATEDLRAMEERVRRSEEAHTALLEINAAGREQIAQERAFRTQFRDTVKDFVRRSQELRDLQLISEVELLKARLELAAAEKDLNISEQSYHKIGLERTQLETERQLQRSEEQSEIGKLKVTAEGLRQRLEGSATGLLSVRAPYPAVVTSLGQKNVGGVVGPGQELCQLARLESRPVAALDLPQNGLDRVAPGQTARLFFDAFPYQRYGTLPSRVDWVSPSAITASNRLEFRARAPLGRDTFPTPAGAVAVRVGMVGDARIRVGTRTLIEFAFEPLKALRERFGVGADAPPP
ncbi:MAG: HlyD family efflux transporter periplasmic adaptor subunit, partial [Verrucomicrobia bacterium]|nr:HlyD family efflux transporter periplasmic adaptor subunit [Verrucomicrobiota bacterium]